MVRGKKTISNNMRGKIDTLKNNIRFAFNPFWGVGYVFNTALKEIKSEGVNIKFNKEKNHYYNPLTVSKIWGY